MTGPAENKQNQEERKNKPSAPDLRAKKHVIKDQDVDLDQDQPGLGFLQGPEWYVDWF